MKYILKIEDSVYTLIRSNYLIFPSQGVVTRTAQHKPLTEYIMAIVFDWPVNTLETMFTFLLSWRNKKTAPLTNNSRSKTAWFL